MFVKSKSLKNFFFTIHLQWVLSPKYFNFPLPITLTMIHMGFSGIVAFVLVRVLKVPFMFSLFVVSSVLEIILYFFLSINHNHFLVSV